MLCPYSFFYALLKFSLNPLSKGRLEFEEGDHMHNASNSSPHSSQALLGCSKV